MKKIYQSLSVRTLELSAEGAILKGSITSEPVVVPNSVPVKEFENGFTEESFEINF